MTKEESGYTDSILFSDAAKTASYLKVTTDYPKKSSIHKLPATTTIVTMDVRLLYTNIPPMWMDYKL